MYTLMSTLQSPPIPIYEQVWGKGGEYINVLVAIIFREYGTLPLSFIVKGNNTHTYTYTYIVHYRSILIFHSNSIHGRVVIGRWEVVRGWIGKLDRFTPSLYILYTGRLSSNDTNRHSEMDGRLENVNNFDIPLLSRHAFNMYSLDMSFARHKYI